MQICWDPTSDSFKNHDLGLLLLLGSKSPSVRIEFVPYRVADLKMWPEEDLCDFCVGQEDEFARRWDYPDELCSCFGSDMDHEE